jgi:hypothetical protein
MAQKFKHKTFFVNVNNGVTALASERVVNEQAQRKAIASALTEPVRGNGLAFDVRRAIDEGLRLAKGPVFTFVNDERYAKSPWFSGKMWMFEKLVAHIEAEGGTVLEACSFYVPFSNGIETRCSNPDSVCAELEYVTTTQDFVDEFGLTRDQITGKYL